MRAGIAMQHAAYTSAAGFDDHGARVVFGIACVNDDRSIELEGELQLGRERTSLQITRRMVVVRVEAALTNCHRPLRHEGPYGIGIACGVERGRIVRMDAGGGEHESRMRGGDRGGTLRSVDRLTNANERARPGEARALDDGVTVRVERRIGEMRVTVDELQADRLPFSSIYVAGAILLYIEHKWPRDPGSVNKGTARALAQERRTERPTPVGTR